MPLKGHPLAREQIQQLREIGDVVVVYQEHRETCQSLRKWVSQLLLQTWPDSRFELSWTAEDGLRITRTLL